MVNLSPVSSKFENCCNFFKYLDVTNTLDSQNNEKMNETKVSDDKAIEDRPSSNLRKRKSTAKNDLSTQTSASVETKAERESEDEEVENKKLKRKASTSKANSKKQKENNDSNGETNVKLELKQEPDEDHEDAKIKTRTKSTKKMSVNYEEEEDDDEVEEKIEVKQEVKEEQSIYLIFSYYTLLQNWISFNKFHLKVKTIKYTGQVPLDEKFSELIGHEYRIYREGDIIYDCMLNQVR